MGKTAGFHRGIFRIRGRYQPDALFADPSGNYLLVGDAKNADNETTSNSATLKRILNYFQWFHQLLGNPYVGGRLALATNTAEDAEKWVMMLNVLAETVGISASLPPKSPNFRAQHYTEKTWIVFW